MMSTCIPNLAKPDIYFSGGKQPVQVLSAEVTQPRLKRPGAGGADSIPRPVPSIPIFLENKFSGTRKEPAVLIPPNKSKRNLCDQD